MGLPTEMRAVTVDQTSRKMSLCSHKVPRPGSGEILVHVAATAVNRADLLQRAGKYAPPPGVTDVMGLEAAGTVVAVGGGVESWRAGEHVCCLLAGGGYAEYVVCPQEQALPIPPGWSMHSAAALPEALFTAYLNLYLEGRLAPGESALIHAGASGVGTTAIQLCVALGNPVYATASGNKLERLRTLGVSAAWDRRSEDFVEAVRTGTKDGGVDVILDPVGGGYLERNLRALAVGGRLVVIGLMGGANADLPLAPVLRRRLQITGSVLRPRSREDKGRIADDLRRRVWPLLDATDGRKAAIKPVTDSTFAFADIEMAHARVSSNETVGKVIVSVAE